MTRMESPLESTHYTVRQLLRYAVEALHIAGVDTPFLDAEVMLSQASGSSRVELIAHPDLQLPPETALKFAEWVYRRSQREPLAYIVGKQEFFGICFEVTPAVLIPRPETEILVETAIEFLKNLDKPILADIGIGSGAVAVSIAKNVENVFVYGTELSQTGLDVARRNVEHVGVQDKVQLLNGDLLEPLISKKFDLIVSNPPYIASGEIDNLQPEIAKYEPKIALDGGPDGLDYYRRLSAEAPDYLKADGILAVEVGFGQSDSVKTIFESNGFQNVRSVNDYGGIERVIAGEKGGE